MLQTCLHTHAHMHQDMQSAHMWAHMTQVYSCTQMQIHTNAKMQMYNNMCNHTHKHAHTHNKFYLYKGIKNTGYVHEIKAEKNQ